MNNTPQINYTDHAQLRSSQRGISSEEIRSIIETGTCIRKQGLRFYYGGSKIADKLHEIGMPDSTSKLVVVMDGEENVVINFKGSYIDEGVTAFYGDKDVSSDVEVISNLNTEKLGDYLIQYLHMDKTISRFIEVKDTQPPRIELLGDEDMVIKMHSEFVDPLYKVIDNYDEDLNEKVVSENNIRLCYRSVISRRNSKLISFLFKPNHYKGTPIFRILEFIA